MAHGSLQAQCGHVSAWGEHMARWGLPLILSLLFEVGGRSVLSEKG